MISEPNIIMVCNKDINSPIAIILKKNIES